MGTEPEDFEMVAASLRADSADLPAFVEALAAKLVGALPGHCEVERRAKKLFSHDKVVRNLSVSVGDWRYTLQSDGAGAVETARAKAVRGIVLKNERLPLAEWIQGLARDLSAEAATSEQARIALERLLT
ncbi:MAG: hypothetical protein QOD62_1194 [Actinomycetota bacterium]|jgi:hypothetical protein|nr:hypothetical protein [Actinomycetota bacterium]